MLDGCTLQDDEPVVLLRYTLKKQPVYVVLPNDVMRDFPSNVRRIMDIACT